MPSKRKQTNMRLAEEAEERLARIMKRMARIVGHPVSQADVVATSLAWMEYRIGDVEAAAFVPPGQSKPYREPPPEPAPPADAPKGKRRKT